MIIIIAKSCVHLIFLKVTTCLLYRFSITSHSTPLLFVPAGPVIPAISLSTSLSFLSLLCCCLVQLAMQFLPVSLTVSLQSTFVCVQFVLSAYININPKLVYIQVICVFLIITSLKHKMSVSVCYTLVLSTPRTFIGALYNFSIKFNISSNVIVLYNGTIMFTVETTMFYVINFVFKFLMLATKFLHKSCP